MELSDFLDQYVEGYLFKDLESMGGITLPRDQHYGAVSWPMVLSVLSGMELLGALLFDHEFQPDNGDTYFKQYWVQFLGAVFPAYNKVQVGADLMRALVRNGLAHAFLTAPGINVTKGERQNHLRFYPAPDNVLSIDCLQLADDFRESYVTKVCPIVCGTPLGLGPRKITRDTMQQRLNEVAGHYTVVATRYLGALPSTRLVNQGRIRTYRSSSVPSLTEGSMGPLYPELSVSSVGPGTQPVFSSDPTAQPGSD